MSRLRSVVVVSLALLAASVAAPAQEEGGGRPGGRDQGERGNRDREQGQDKIKPFDKVITEDARTDKGLFTIHQVKDKIYYEIPTDQLDLDFLWVTQIAKTTTGAGYGGTGAGNKVVRWELRGEDVLLREVKYSIRADGDDSISNAVEASSLAPIIMTFPVKAWGRDKSPLIDVSDLIKGDVSAFSPKRRLGASSMDKKRTFVESIKAFPENIEAKVLATFARSQNSGARGQDRPEIPERSRRRSSGGDTITALVHYSMVALPKDPMQARRYDDRVGYFNVSFEDYGTDEHEVKRDSYITRWRLEKKDPKAEVSDPNKPIVFYVGRGVPQKWKPWVKKGIEAWQPAFEQAGFSNAIVGEYAPDVREDPDWDAEDARISSIRWLPSTTENAMGPHVHDPRTGEILEADIIVYHNILKLCRDWYFTQASPMDERAQKLPLPDDLMGELLAYVIAHEVGHSLGFRHNMKASSSYTVEQLRDPEFTAKYGNEASIMDYGRFNYVAQPGDGARLIPIVGPYDFFAVEWGYRRFPGADTHEKEKAHLARITARQVDDPVLRFGDPNPGEDPSQQTEDLGSDAVAATLLGLKNIDRVASYLVDATCKEGEDYDLLENMYTRLLNQRNRELGHVANVVGGVERTNLWYGDADRRFEPLLAARQREAIAFLNEHAFQTPPQLVPPDILDRIEAEGAARRILSGHDRLLSTLISETRIKRMAEVADRHGSEAYTPMAMLSDLRAGIWSELGAPNVSVDLYRRNLQRAHVEKLSEQINKKETDSDLPALSRGELTELLHAIRAAIEASGDEITRLHLEDLETRIDHLLEPRSALPEAIEGSPFSSSVRDHR